MMNSSVFGAPIGLTFIHVGLSPTMFKDDNKRAQDYHFTTYR